MFITVPSRVAMLTALCHPLGWTGLAIRWLYMRVESCCCAGRRIAGAGPICGILAAMAAKVGGR